MNSTELINLINTTVPVVANSALAIKLIDCVKDVITALYEPRLVYRKKKAKYKAEIEMKQSIEGEVVFTQYEISKLKNFLKTANFANEELSSRMLTYEEDPGAVTDSTSDSSTDSQDVTNSAGSAQVDFDWIMRFFDAVSLVSTEQLQQLWGKILSDEIIEPGTISLRTLDIVRNLTVSEARSFNELCRYVMECGNTKFVIEYGFNVVPQGNSPIAGFNTHSNALIKSRGLNYLDNINPLIEAGLMVADHDFEGIIDGEFDSILMFNNRMVAIVTPKENYETVRFQPYMLTKSGSELYRVISNSKSFTPEVEYNICCLREMQIQYPGADFIIRLVDGDNVEEVSSRFEE